MLKEQSFMIRMEFCKIIYDIFHIFFSSLGENSFLIPFSIDLDVEVKPKFYSFFIG